MRNLFTLILLAVFSQVIGQDSMEKTIEKRAREMHRVISLDDPAAWKKFVGENYTKALIERPMKTKVVTGDEENAPKETGAKSPDAVADKAGMFSMLHADFGDSKIQSIRITDAVLVMELKSSDGMRGTFNLTFEKKSPYLIDKIAVEVDNVQR